MALFSYPVCTWLCQYVNMGVRKWLEKSAEKQKYKMRKTANPLSRKAFRAVSFSATKDSSSQASYRLRRAFSFHCKAHRALILLLLASKPQPLCWVAVWFWAQTWRLLHLFRQQKTRRSKVRFAPTSFYARGKRRHPPAPTE